MRPAWRRATARRDLRVFSGCVPYCRIRPALTVPYFSAAGCPRRVCRNPYGIFGLFWILLPVLTCTVQPVGHFHQHMQNVRGLHLVQVLAPLLLGAVATACICYPSRQAATLAQARMSRMAASAASARMSNMKRIPAHGGWLLARKRSAPCADTR